MPLGAEAAARHEERAALLGQLAQRLARRRVQLRARDDRLLQLLRCGAEVVVVVEAVNRLGGDVRRAALLVRGAAGPVLPVVQLRQPRAALKKHLTKKNSKISLSGDTPIIV